MIFCLFLSFYRFLFVCHSKYHTATGKRPYALYRSRCCCIQTTSSSFATMFMVIFVIVFVKICLSIIPFVVCCHSNPTESRSIKALFCDKQFHNLLSEIFKISNYKIDNNSDRWLQSHFICFQASRLRLSVSKFYLHFAMKGRHF